MSVELYRDGVLQSYKSGNDNAFEAYQNAGYELIQGESDIEFVRRCAEQDYVDGVWKGAVYQELFDKIANELSVPAISSTKLEIDESQIDMVRALNEQRVRVHRTSPSDGNFQFAVLTDSALATVREYESKGGDAPVIDMWLVNRIGEKLEPTFPAPIPVEYKKTFRLNASEQAQLMSWNACVVLKGFVECVGSDGIKYTTKARYNIESKKLESVDSVSVVAPFQEVVAKYWQQGSDIVEEALAKAKKNDPSDAPFPLTGEAAALYNRGLTDAYQHALEMMGVPRTTDEKRLALKSEKSIDWNMINEPHPITNVECTRFVFFDESSGKAYQVGSDAPLPKPLANTEMNSAATTVMEP